MIDATMLRFFCYFGAGLLSCNGLDWVTSPISIGLIAIGWATDLRNIR